MNDTANSAIGTADGRNESTLHPKMEGTSMMFRRIKVRVPDSAGYFELLIDNNRRLSGKPPSGKDTFTPIR